MARPTRDPDPRSILMIKGHSAGIGDLLRSSAAWRALQDRFPGARLHLLMLTTEPGYASEAFIARHDLLGSFLALDKRTNGIAGWRKFLRRAGKFARACQPELIIDFEPHGLRTSLLTRWLQWRSGARTVGIAQVPLRGLFYSRAAVSNRKFARARNLPARHDYTNRDFVALSALGIERGNTAIEMAEPREGREFRATLRRRFGLPEDARLLTINIGCGTPGAAGRRASALVLSGLAAHLQRRHGLHLVVGTGPPFEQEIDAAFLKLHRAQCDAPVIDLRGEINLFQFMGVLRASTLFVTSDSGPYHIGVALKTPTLAVFNFENPEAVHNHPWVKCVCATSLEQLPALIAAAEELLARPAAAR